MDWLMIALTQTKDKTSRPSGTSTQANTAVRGHTFDGHAFWEVGRAVLFTIVRFPERQKGEKTVVPTRER